MKKLLYILLTSTILISCNYSEIDDPKYDAKVNVEDYVRNHLKSPSTAEFTSVTVSEINESTYHVQGNVDAENSFGAMTRKEFSCEIEFIPGDKYRINELKLY